MRKLIIGAAIALPLAFVIVPASALPGAGIGHSPSSDLIEVKRGEQIIETAREARQAEPGPSVRNVLVISTVAVIVLFAIIYFAFIKT